MNRTIELYLNPGHFTGPAARILRAFHDSRGPDDQVFGTRIVTLNPNIASDDEQTFTVTVDQSGARLVFEDEVPGVMTTLLGPKDVRKIVITDWVPAGYGPKLDLSAGYGQADGAAYAWRVTPRSDHGLVVHEIIVHANNLPLAVDCLEGLLRGERSDAAPAYLVSPWTRVGLGQ